MASPAAAPGPQSGTGEPGWRLLLTPATLSLVIFAALGATTVLLHRSPRGDSTDAAAPWVLLGGLAGSAALTGAVGLLLHQRGREVRQARRHL